METDEKDNETYRRILKAKISMHKEFPFFYDLLFFMRISKEDNPYICPTMAVDLHGNITYAESFIKTLSADELRTVLTHEVLHKSLLHVPRGISYLRLNDKMRDMPKWRKWNKAVDCQVNFVLSQNNFRFPKGTACVPVGNDVRILASDGSEFYMVRDVAKKSAEEIFREIPDETCSKCHLPFGLPQRKGQPQNQNGKGNPDKKGQGQGDEKQDKGDAGQGEQQQQDGQGQGDGQGGHSHGQSQQTCKCKGHGKMMMDGEADDYHNFGDGRVSDEELRRIEEEWKQRVINAASRCKTIGKVPSGLQRYIDELIEPKIDWRTKLYRFITDGIPNDYTYSKKNRRSDSFGYYMPSYLKEKLEVAVFIDTSGSIGDDELKDFKSECVGIARSFEGIEMILGYCDAKVQGEPLEVANGNIAKIMESKAMGGGGTDMREIFKWLKKKDNKSEIVVIFTDGYTPYPTKEEIGNRQVLWVISEKGHTEEQMEKQNVIGDIVKLK